MAESEIKVVSLNCWGLKFVSKDRHVRVAAIADALSKSTHDIVALQEIWVQADFERVRQSLSVRLPYNKLFHSGAIGAGLAIFSRWPIIETSTNPYSLRGEPMDAFGGDWFAGKGACSVVIKHPVLGQVQIFNTHLYAKGGEDGPEYNRTHRLINAWEFAKLTKQAANLGRYVIACGDFNSIPQSLTMAIIRDYSGLTDSWVATHPRQSPPSGMISPIEGVEQYGITADSPLNSYRDSGPSGSSIVRTYQGKRLDYILYRQPAGGIYRRSSLRLESTHCRVVFADPIPSGQCSYSDHFGVESYLTIQSPDEIENNSEDSNDTNGSSVWVDAQGSKDDVPVQGHAAVPDLVSSLSADTISSMLLALTTSYRISKDRSHRELSVFVLCILLLFALIVSSSWVPLPWVNPIFVFFTIFVAWVATTMLYEGWIFGRWELKALLTVIEELDLYQKNLETHSRAAPSGRERW
ncbi:inositol phosphophingolipids phospholipase C [Coniophora puteana RWD-64-598 SS2]|uniref:Inositol phosphophingolipids phospholipase C n=1 Tax=Coniophora puteana (strain RWD-64-598) TaxID=741705 RepID=A0A5M3N7W6_CONPW|nr:inositol phosphophingolipids phospholipase C [Coniophora puteana RWD-64-598 SS2]EIW86951.1 inositol phosphophingolipids phospholipase C [Coniophora puteana RWD-64-598 SS2]